MRKIILGALAALCLAGQAQASYIRQAGPPTDPTINVATPTVGQTVTVAQTTGTQIIDPAGALATLTLTLPICSAAYNGQMVRIGSTQVVTALTMTAAGGSISSALSSLAVGSTPAYICYGANTTWYPVA